jgi:cytochrome c peroxidase
MVSLACVLMGMPFTASLAAAESPTGLLDKWSPADLQTLATMHITEAGSRPADPSNAFEDKTEAADLGRLLFNDTRLSRTERVSCATCHVPGAQFEDGKPLGHGLDTGRRRTMPVMGAARAPFLFWDGRKDSLWAQALGPMEDAAEHGGNRGQLVRVVLEHYASRYEKIFGPLPDLHALTFGASPLGTSSDQAAWKALRAETREQINRVFANMGKAIAAYERRVEYGPSRFDQYVQSTLQGNVQEAFNEQEVRGLRLFLGKGQCSTCHNGPMLSDYAFHNTGVAPLNPKSPDRGRADAIQKLLADEFNCLGPFSDAEPEQCGELNFLSTQAPSQSGAFRTPSLRNVAARAPYMHAGQLATLRDVLRHYSEAPKSVAGQSELAHEGEKQTNRQFIQLAPPDIEDLVAFLNTLTGPVTQPK